MNHVAAGAGNRTEPTSAATTRGPLERESRRADLPKVVCGKTPPAEHEISRAIRALKPSQPALLPQPQRSSIRNRDVAAISADFHKRNMVEG